jgi:ribosome biogenesis GTP-binding protein YsxC/EngB
MKINSAEFKSSAPDLRACPAWAWPEFALIGRSNVGKSSLINLLTGRRDLAKVSATPGKTRLMNFFLVNGRWSLVDLPGYGYAKVGKEQRADFNEAVADYIANRPNLRRVLVLIDSRLEPQAIDLDFLRWLEEGDVSYAIIFTKADKQSASQTRATMDVFRRAIGAWRSEMPTMIASSAKAGVGRGEIFAEIHAALGE